MENAKFIVNVSGSCYDHIRPSSDGIWNLKEGETILQYNLVRFHIQIALMFIISNTFHFFLKRLHFPRLTSEALTGMLMGATIMRRYFTETSKLLFPQADQVLVPLAKTGYVIFIFVAAVKMDPNMVRKIGVKGVLIGIVLTAYTKILQQYTHIKFERENELVTSMKISMKNKLRVYTYAVTTSQFVGVSTLLMQQKITNSRLGHIALAAGLVTDLLRLIANVGFQTYNQMNQISMAVGLQIFFATSFLGFFIIIILRLMMFFFIRRTPEGKPITEIGTVLVIALLLIVSSLGDAVGSAFTFGSFLLGLVVPTGSPLASSIVAKLDTLNKGFFVPIMVMVTAINIDLVYLYNQFSWLIHFQTMLISYAFKLVVTFMVVLCLMLPIKDAIALTLILNIKGIAEFGMLLCFADFQSWEEEVQTNSIIMTIFILGSIVPPLVKLLYDPAKQYIGHKKKSFQYAPDDEEPHVLVCAHRQDDAMAAVKLLEFSNPNNKLPNPVNIYGLCLEELFSSATPVLINHQLGQKTNPARNSRSQSIIEIFQYFKSQNMKSAQLNIFTAISPLQQMHEDICSLAFDKGVSLIVLPFHKKWNSKSKLASSSNDLRNVNISVLDRAPCSVGILIDRSRTRSLSSIFFKSAPYNVATLFLGGPDDREALAYAVKMARNPRVVVTIIHCTSPFDDSVHDEWEKLLDVESLKELKNQISRTTNICYLQEIVRDGSDTASMVCSMDENYDLIMVGRRHEGELKALAGLSEWTELTELGPLGDMFASNSEITSETSVLVIQQQIMKQSHSSILNKR